MFPTVDLYGIKSWFRFGFLFVIGFILCFLIHIFPLQNPVYAESGVSKQLVEQGIASYQKNQFSEAIAFWEQALSQLLSNEDKVIVYNNLAQAYRKIGQLDQAIEAWEKAIQLSPFNNELEVAKFKIEQGQTYSELGQHEQAIKLLESVLKIAKENKDEELAAIAQGSLANSYWALGDYSTALIAGQASVIIAQNINNNSYLATALNNLGNIYFSLAEKEIFQANLADLEGDIFGKEELEALAESHFQTALNTFQKSVEISETVGGMTAIRTRLNFNRMLRQLPLDLLKESTEILVRENQNEILSLLNNQPPSRDKAYALINLADSL